MRRNTLHALLVVVIALFLTVGVRAQDSAAITGTVTDTTGALIPNTAVVVKNVLNGGTFTQKTDNHGTYHFFGMAPTGGYVIIFSHDGFANVEQTGITLSVGLTRTIDATLQPASATATATVTAANTEVTLDTTDAEIGNNISVEQLNELPVYDRTNGIATLFNLQPGVVSNGNDMSVSSVTGARTDQSSVTVDGLDVNDIAAGTAFAIVGTAPVDSVEQFTGTVGGLQSNIGTGSGGQFQLVTKSGTNHFHGNINEYHRDTTTEANDWFNNFHGLPRTPLIRNQFGGNVGGPVLRNKLFFFFDYGGSRIVQSSSIERTVPNDYIRNGQLNYINNSAPNCDSSVRQSTSPSCVTTLSGPQIASYDPNGQGYSSSIQAFLTKRYPAANDPGYGDGVNTAGYYFTYPTPDSQNTYVARVDYQINNTQKLYGRFTINRETAVESLPEFDTDPNTHPRFDKSYAYVISHVWTIGANKVNQAYYGDTIQKLQFPDVYNPTGANQYSFTGFDGPYTGYDGQQRRIPIPLVRDDFNWQLGAHSISFGGLFKWIKTSSLLVSDFANVSIGAAGSNLSNGLDPSDYPADISSDTVAQQNYANLFVDELGAIGQINRNYNYNNKGQALAPGTGSNRNYRYYQFEAYIGDSWKLSPKLTLSYGVRYQMDTSPYEVNGDESVPTWIPFNNFISTREQAASSGNTSNTGVPIFSWELGGPKNHGPNYFNTPKGDFAPRVAIAYSPYASGKTVFNAGAGIDYDRTVINTINFLQDQISFLFTNTPLNTFGPLGSAPRVTDASLAYDTSNIPAPLPVASPYTPYVAADGTPVGIGSFAEGFVISKDLKDPYSYAFNFGVQQEFPGHYVLKLNWDGRLGRHLLADADANQILDTPDFVGHSNQSMVQAFAALTTQMRNGGAITPQPWFENMLGSAAADFGFSSNTALVARLAGTDVYNGDMADAIVTMNAYKFAYGDNNLWPNNVGIPGQFAGNPYLTNMGSSNYHALLVTVSKNMSHGLRFDANYTWSHSIDNNSQAANNNALYNVSGILCDIKQPRACRGNSDFDVRHVINGDFIYELPFGRKRDFASNVPQWLDEAIGGWELSGIPTYRTGLPVNPLSVAFIASDFSEAAAIWTGTNKGDLKPSVNVDRNAGAVYMFKGGNAGAVKTVNEFQSPVGLQFGARNFLRGPSAFFFDAGLGKTFPIIEDKLNLKFRADAFNVFNHAVFSPGASNVVNNASNFGQITSAQAGSSGYTARVAQFSLRLEF